MNNKFLKEFIIKVACPNCDTVTKISLEDFRRGRTIKCHGCQASIKLEDRNRDTKKIEDSLKKSNKTIKINFKL